MVSTIALMERMRKIVRHSRMWQSEISDCSCNAKIFVFSESSSNLDCYVLKTHIKKIWLFTKKNFRARKMHLQDRLIYWRPNHPRLRGVQLWRFRCCQDLRRLRLLKTANRRALWRPAVLAQYKRNLAFNRMEFHGQYSSTELRAQVLYEIKKNRLKNRSVQK